MDLPTLTLDHRYVLNQNGRDIEIPSVTSILVAAGLCDLTFVAQYALDRGTALHDAILYHHEGTLDEEALDPAVKGHFEQYKRFLSISGAKVLKAEQIVYDSFRNYAGKYDLLVKLNGATWLIDVKTNTKPKHVEVQLGAYYSAMKPPPRRMGCLVLKKDKFSLHEYTPYSAQVLWNRALTKARTK